MSDTTRNEWGGRRALAMVGATLAVMTAAAPVQAKLALPSGSVTITGTRYVNGNPHMVKCTAAEGNVLDATSLGHRVLQLVYGASCGVYSDTNDADELVFSGPEAFVDSFMCSSKCKSVKGPIIYHRSTPYGDVVFIGTYKARF